MRGYSILWFFSKSTEWNPDRRPRSSVVMGHWAQQDKELNVRHAVRSEPIESAGAEEKSDHHDGPARHFADERFHVCRGA